MTMPLITQHNWYLMQDEEDQASADCGCTMVRDLGQLGDGAVTFVFCSTHEVAPKLLKALKDIYRVSGHFVYDVGTTEPVDFKHISKICHLALSAIHEAANA